MTARTRRRWHHAAATEPCFVHQLGTAVLDAPTNALRSAVGCRNSRDFERQLAAAETEGWLERSPEVCIDLARLDARMTQDRQMSDREYEGARTDIGLLAEHGIEITAGPSDWVVVDADGAPVDLGALAELLGVRSSGTAHWRLKRMRRLLDSEEPLPSPTGMTSADAISVPFHASPTAPAGVDRGLAERIVGLLETETNPDVRVHLAQALAAACGSRTVIATDSRKAPIREPDATDREESVRVRSESVQEQELPVPIREQTTQNTREAQSRTARALPTSDKWSSSAELEPIVRPFEQRTTTLGPGARRALMEWDPDQVQHAIDVLIGWIDNGFVVKNASAYITTAARSGYTSLFPLSSPTADSETVVEQAEQMWAQRAATLPAATCVDLIDNAHGPAPGRTYDRVAHLAALTAAVCANPDIALHYCPEHPDAPGIDELPTAPATAGPSAEAAR